MMFGNLRMVFFFFITLDISVRIVRYLQGEEIQSLMAKQIGMIALFAILILMYQNVDRAKENLNRIIHKLLIRKEISESANTLIDYKISRLRLLCRVQIIIAITAIMLPLKGLFFIEVIFDIIKGLINVS